MPPSDGPPARSCRATHTTRRNQALEPLSGPPREGPKSMVSAEESQLISIAEAPGDEIRHVIETTSQDERNISYWGRGNSPHATPVEEEWAQLERALEKLTDLAEQSKVELRRTMWEIVDLQDRVDESYARVGRLAGKICDVRRIIARLHMRSEVQHMPSTPSQALRDAGKIICSRMQREGRMMPSEPLSALASRAPYAAPRSHEGPAGDEHRRSARVHLELPQPSEDARMEEVADNNSSRLTYIGVREGGIDANSAPAEDAASVELAGAVKSVATTKPGASEPLAEDELHGLDTAPQRSLLARMCVSDIMPWYDSTDGEQTLEAPVPAASTVGKRKCGLEILPLGAQTKRIKYCRAKDGENRGD
jgi:hypothetical protein